MCGVLCVIDGVFVLADDGGADGFGPGFDGAVAHAPSQHIMGHFAGIGAFVLGEVGHGGIYRQEGALFFVGGRRAVEFDEDLGAHCAARTAFVVGCRGFDPTVGEILQAFCHDEQFPLIKIYKNYFIRVLWFINETG